MKYYCNGHLLKKIEGQDYTLLIGADIKSSRGGCIIKTSWGAGWIFEADESFRSWCVIGYGFDLVEIDDQEFNSLSRDGIAFVSRERMGEIRKAEMTQLSLIAINS